MTISRRSDKRAQDIPPEIPEEEKAEAYREEASKVLLKSMRWAEDHYRDIQAKVDRIYEYDSVWEDEELMRRLDELNNILDITNFRKILGDSYVEAMGHAFRLVQMTKYR